MHRVIFAIICSSILLCQHLNAQNKIEFTNPSFEGDVAHSHTPTGWYTCQKGLNSPPDIHNGKKTIWKNTQRPANGFTYVGLVLRQDGVIEHIGTELPDELKAGQHYAFSVKLSIPETFRGKLRNNTIIAFEDPVALEVWGSNSSCDYGELLHTTDVVHKTNWKTYKIHLKPSEDYTWLHLIPRYINDEAYNAALLVDGLSPIHKTDSLYNFRPEHFDCEHLYLSLKGRNKDANISYNVLNEYYIQEVVKSPTGNAKQILLYDFSVKDQYSVHNMDSQSISMKNGVSKTFDLYSNRLIKSRNYKNGRIVKGSLTMNGLR